MLCPECEKEDAFEIDRGYDYEDEVHYIRYYCPDCDCDWRENDPAYEEADYKDDDFNFNEQE